MKWQCEIDFDLINSITFSFENLDEAMKKKKHLGLNGNSKLLQMHRVRKLIKENEKEEMGKVGRKQKCEKTIQKTSRWTKWLYGAKKH